jgi:hypothetical protein
MSNFKEPCPAPNCSRLGDFARGFCNFHYREFKKACIANGSWSRSVEIPKPVIPKFEWLGDEKALIEMTEQGEREKQ